MRDFVRRKRIPEPLASQIMHFYAAWRRTKRDADVLGGLPSSLRALVCAQMHMATVKGLGCFSETSEEFLLTVTAHLVAELYMPQTSIVQTGDEPSAIYFISRGVAERSVETAEGAPTVSAAPPQKQVRRSLSGGPNLLPGISEALALEKASASSRLGATRRPSRGRLGPSRLGLSQEERGGSPEGASSGNGTNGPAEAPAGFQPKVPTLIQPSELPAAPARC